MADAETDEPADDSNQVLSRFHALLVRLTLERLSEAADQKLLEALRPLVVVVVEEAVRVTLWRLNDDGFCSFSFHHAEADDFRANGKCASCEEPRESHLTMLVCRNSEASTAELTKHRDEIRANAARQQPAEEG